MNKRFVRVESKKFDVLISGDLVISGGVSESFSEIDFPDEIKFASVNLFRLGKIMCEGTTLTCFDFSPFLGSYVDEPIDGSFWSYAVFEKSKFPQLKDYFCDDQNNFAVSLSRGAVYVSELPLEDFKILPGKIGSCVNEVGFLAFHFTDNKKIQYLIDFERFIKFLCGGKI